MNTGMSSTLRTYIADVEKEWVLPDIRDYVPSMRSDKIRAMLKPLLERDGVVWGMVLRGETCYIAFNPCPQCGTVPRSIEQRTFTGATDNAYVATKPSLFTYPCCPDPHRERMLWDYSKPTQIPPKHVLMSHLYSGIAVKPITDFKVVDVTS